MDQKEYNAEINAHLGALKGIDETIPKCDKPCNVHEAYVKKQEHQIAIIGLMAQYTGNGMSSDIAAKVAPVVAQTVKNSFPPILTTEEIAKHVTPIVIESIIKNTPPPVPQPPQPKIYAIQLPGTNKLIEFTKDKLFTWTFRTMLLIILAWISTGKIDKTSLRSAVKEVIQEEVVKTSTNHFPKATN